MKHKKFIFILTFSLCFSLFFNSFFTIFAEDLIQTDETEEVAEEEIQTEQPIEEEEIEEEIVESEQEEIENTQTIQTEINDEIQTEQTIEQVTEEQPIMKALTVEAAVTRSNAAAALKSYGLPVLDIQLSGVTLDTINAGTKDIKYDGNTVYLYDKNSGLDFIADNVTIKGHGNSSWKDNKKPYQLKFDNKVSLFGMPEAKKYLLIANYRDKSLLRNAICYDLAAALGIAPSTYQFVDLYVDKAYIGNYMLIQKVECGKNSVNLKDPAGIIAEIDIHPDVDDITFRSAYSNALCSVKDYKDDYNTGITYFLDSFQKAERYAKQKNWGQLSKLIDVDSFAKYYLLSEISSNPDAQRTSFYIVKDGAVDVLHAGPAWDYDRAFGNYYNEYYTDPYYGSIYNDQRVQEENGTKILSDMMKIPEFRDIVDNMWRQSVRASIQAEYNNIDVMNSTISKSLAADHSKWGLSSDLSLVKSFITKRIEYLDMLLGQNQDIDTSQLYKITNGSYCISTANPNTTNGEAATLRKQRIKESQLFSFEKVDNRMFYIIKQKSSGYVLTVKGNSLNKKCDVQLSKNENKDSQKWKVIKKNNKYVIMSKLNGMVLDIRGGQIASGTQIQMYHFNNTNSQYFAIVKNPHPFVSEDMSGTYVILNSQSNYMVAIAGDSKDIRANVCGSASYIQNNWYTVKKHGENYYTIQNNKSKYYLDVQGGGTSDKTNVQQYKSNGTASQDWAFIKNSDGSFLIVSRQNGLVLNLTGANINVRRDSTTEKHKWIFLKKK